MIAPKSKGRFSFSVPKPSMKRQAPPGTTNITRGFRSGRSIKANRRSAPGGGSHRHQGEVHRKPRRPEVRRFGQNIQRRGWRTCFRMVTFKYQLLLMPKIRAHTMTVPQLLKHQGAHNMERCQCDSDLETHCTIQPLFAVAMLFSRGVVEECL